MDQSADVVVADLKTATPRAFRVVGLGVELGEVGVAGALAWSVGQRFPAVEFDFLVLVAVVVGAAVAHSVVHEFGHLTGALLVRLRVESVVVRGGRLVRWRWGGVAFGVGVRGRSFVRYDPHVVGRAGSVRNALVTFAGPLANLVVGGVALLVAREHGIGALGRAALLVFAAVGGLGFVGNMVPLGQWSTRMSDGKRLGRWVLRPEATLAEARRAWQVGRIVHARDVLRGGRVPDLGELRGLVEVGEGDVAARAGLVLLASVTKAGPAQFAAERGRLVSVARREGLSATVGGALASGVAWLSLYWMFVEYVRTRRAVDPAEIGEAAELAELGHRRNPEAAQGRYTLAMARCVQSRGEEARNLLVLVSTDVLPAVERVNVLAVRAIAEVLLQDDAQARRLVTAARRENQPSALLEIVWKLIEDRSGARESEAAASDGA